jgi:hypothetical protein
MRRTVWCNIHRVRVRGSRQKKVQLAGLLYRDGLIKGTSKKFPIVLESRAGLYIEKVEVDSTDDLVEYLYDHLKDPFNAKKPLKKNLQELGIKDTVMLLDDRTEQILNEYIFHRANPANAHNSHIWYESVIILNGILWQT